MTLFALAVLATTAGATEIGSGRPFGLGLQLGEPTAITGKLYLGGRRNALDFALGTRYDSDWGPDESVFAQVSYHWHVAELTSGSGVTIPFRVGVGGFLDTSDYGNWDPDWDEDFAIGARVPLGLDFDLETAPVQFYVELAPEVFVLPPLEFEWDAGVGVRYYF